MDNVFVLGLILMIILCIVIVLNSKTRQFFFNQRTPEEKELVWNPVVNERVGEIPGRAVLRNGVYFYKIFHRYTKDVGQFSKIIKENINRELNDSHIFVVVNFKQLSEETENGETHKMEMKIWLKNGVENLEDSKLLSIKQEFQDNINFNPKIEESAECDKKWLFTFIDGDLCGRDGDFDENDEKLRFDKLYCNDTIPVVGSTKSAPLNGENYLEMKGIRLTIYQIENLILCVLVQKIIKILIQVQFIV